MIQSCRPWSRSIPLVATLVTFTASASLAQTRWSPFTSKEGGYAVVLPSKPVEEVKTGNSPLGRLPIHVAKAVIPDRHLLFWVSHMDVPPTRSKINSKKFLDAVRDNSPLFTRARVVRERRISLGAYPGRELIFQGPRDTIFKTRVYLVGRRVYQVMVGTVRPNANAPEATRFFDSFRLTTR